VLLNIHAMPPRMASRGFRARVLLNIRVARSRADFPAGVLLNIRVAWPRAISGGSVAEYSRHASSHGRARIFRQGCC
jgi:hypothetical protein